VRKSAIIVLFLALSNQTGKTGEVMKNLWFFALIFLSGCAHLQPIKLEVTETEGSVAITSNVPSGRTLDLLRGLTQREVMSGALERGVPATIWDQGLPLAKVGGDQPFMYGNFYGYGAGMAYALDPLAAASSNAAEMTYEMQARAQVPEAVGANGSSPTKQTSLEQDVRAIQRWIGVQESSE